MLNVTYTPPYVKAYISRYANYYDVSDAKRHGVEVYIQYNATLRLISPFTRNATPFLSSNPLPRVANTCHIRICATYYNSQYSRMVHHTYSSACINPAIGFYINLS